MEYLIPNVFFLFAYGWFYFKFGADDQECLAPNYLDPIAHIPLIDRFDSENQTVDVAWRFRTFFGIVFWIQLSKLILTLF